MTTPSAAGPSRAAKAIEIVPFSQSYREATLSFFREHSPDHPELASGDLIDWQRSERFLALFKQKIVGHIARIPQEFRRGSEALQLGWAATLVLDTSLPLVQTFAGTALLDQVTSDSRYRFAAVGIVPEIEQTHRRRGFVVNRGGVKMYARFLRPAAMLRYLGKSTAYAIPLQLANAVRRVSSTTVGGTIEEAAAFGPSWDVAWERFLSSRNWLRGIRSAEYLNYKLRQPGKSYHIAIHRSAGGEPDGYAIFRIAENRIKNLRLAKLVDLVGDDRARSALLSYVISWAMSADVDGVVALDSSLDRRLYNGAGLWVSRAFPVVIPPDLDGDLRVSFLDSDLDDLW